MSIEKKNFHLGFSSQNDHFFRFAQWGIAIRKESLVEQLAPKKQSADSLRRTQRRLDELLPQVKERINADIYLDLENITYQYLDQVLRLIANQEQHLEMQINSSETCIQSVNDLYYFMDSLSSLIPIAGPLKAFKGHLEYQIFVSQNIEPGSPMKIEERVLKWLATELVKLQKNIRNSTENL